MSKERTAVIKRLDEVFSAYIRRFYGGVCYTCGCVSAFWLSDCGHYIGRSHLEFRWDPRNARAQCRDCNRAHEGMKAVFRGKLVGEYGLAVVEDMERRARQPYPMSAYDLTTLLAYWRQRLRELIDSRKKGGSNDGHLQAKTT